MKINKSHFKILSLVLAGPLTYDELKALCKTRTLKNRGMFAINLRFLIRKNLINISKIRSTTHYIISSKGLSYYRKSLETRVEEN